MAPPNCCPSIRFRLVPIAGALLALLAYTRPARAQSACVRVSQVGYESGETPFRAYLMSTVKEGGVSFAVVNSKGATSYSGQVGALLGTWSHSPNASYNVYALDFTAPGGETYTISVSGPVHAASPPFAVDAPETLYSGLLLNTLFFYETERDGPNFVGNALRTEPGHLKDGNARAFTKRLRSTATTISTTCRQSRHWYRRSSRTSTPLAVGGTLATMRNTSKRSVIRQR